jgi:hypothetical protein
MIEQLVQVDDATWIDPDSVVLVHYWPQRTISGVTTPANVTIKHRDGRCTISYWPVERVMRALGLVDHTWIHTVWERTA